MKAVDTIIADAREAFERRDYDRALELYELAAAQSAHDCSPYYALGQIFEQGLAARGVDLAQALANYMRLSKCDGRAGSIGHLGVARVLFKGEHRELVDAAIGHCEKSLSISENAHARLLLGAINEYWLELHPVARYHFLAAFKQGMPWGLRFYARSLVRSGRLVAGAIVHVAATLIGPLYLLRAATRSPFG